MPLPAQPNQSLIDGIEVLLALASSEGSTGSRELARRLGMEPTRVNRLLKTLAAIGIAAQDERNRYIPGPGTHVLSAMSLFGSGLVRRAVPILEELGRFEMVVALGVLWRDQVAYLYHSLPGVRSTEALGRVGLFPAVRSSIGVTLLAYKPKEVLDHLYGIETKVRRELDEVLTRVRLEGVASVAAANGTSKAAAIHAQDQEPYAAVAVSGEMSRTRSAEITEALRDAAARIASAI